MSLVQFVKRYRIGCAGLQALIAENTLVLVLFHNRGPVPLSLKDIDRADLHTLSAFPHPNASFQIDLQAYKLAHPNLPGLGVPYGEELTLDFLILR